MNYKSIVAAALGLFVAHAASAAIAHCDWSSPGAARYTGSVAAAIDGYRDIPVETRRVLIDRASRKQYDEFVTIRRDAIVGNAEYSPEIRDMHFGSQGRVCSTITRAGWSATAIERGLVYCEAGHCVLIPTVCGNVSRITRLAPPAEPARVAALPPAAAPPGVAAPPPPGGETPPTPPGLPPLVPPVPPTFEPPPPVVPPPPHFPPVVPPPPVTPPPVTPPPPYRPPPPVPPPVPEPSTWAMLGVGLAMLAMVRRRQTARAGR